MALNRIAYYYFCNLQYFLILFFILEKKMLLVNCRIAVVGIKNVKDKKS